MGYFLIGFFIGGFLGVMVMSLMAMAGRSSDLNEALKVSDLYVESLRAKAKEKLN